MCRDAENVGDNKLDTSAPPTPDAHAQGSEGGGRPAAVAGAAAQARRPAEARARQAGRAEADAGPATEVTPQPQPKQEVKPDPVAETIVADNARGRGRKLPEIAPSPAARPQPPKAETAKAPDRKDTEKPAEKQAAKPKSEEKDFNADEVAALLNKEKASGGGAKRSTDQAALGNERQSNASKLSQSEEDSLRGQVQRCWLIPAGAADGGDLQVSVRFKLDPAGELQGSPEIVSGGGGEGVQRAAAEAARRAVARCAPYNLPAEKYETWAEVIVNFDPSEMF